MKKKIGISFTNTNFQHYWNWITPHDLRDDLELVELSFKKITPQTFIPVMLLYLQAVWTWILLFTMVKENTTTARMSMSLRETFLKKKFIATHN